MNTPTYPPQPNQSSELGDTILVRTAFTAIDHELDAMTDEEIEKELRPSAWMFILLIIINAIIIHIFI